MEDIYWAIHDRLPMPVQTILDHLPAFDTLTAMAARGSGLVQGLFQLASGSGVPYLPLILTLVAVYISLWTMYNTARTAVRATGFVVKYGALLGAAMSAYNYLSPSTGTNTANAPGRRGQEHWQNRPSRDYPGARNADGPSWSSTLLNFLNPEAAADPPRTRSRTARQAAAEPAGRAAPVAQGAKWLFNKVLSGDNLVDSVWEHVKEAGAEAMAGAAQDDGGRRRARRRS
jgi:hypothetical protein